MYEKKIQNFHNRLKYVNKKIFMKMYSSTYTYKIYELFLTFSIMSSDLSPLLSPHIIFMKIIKCPLRRNK